MAASASGKGKGKKMAAEIKVYCDPRLKDEAGKAADVAGLPLSEWAARVMAEAIGRTDLAKIPRKSIGRPRKQASTDN